MSALGQQTWAVARFLWIVDVRQGCGITRGLSNHFCDAFGNLPFPWRVSLEALSVVSQKWSFPTAQI